MDISPVFFLSVNELTTNDKRQVATNYNENVEDKKIIEAIAERQDTLTYNIHTTTYSILYSRGGTTIMMDVNRLCRTERSF